MSKLFLALSFLLLAACNSGSAASGSADFVSRSGIYLVSPSCTYASGPDVWAVYNTAFDQIDIYTTEDDCTNGAVLVALSINNILTENPAQTGLMDYDPQFNSNGNAALLFEAY